jgi:hypothetical protein
VPRIFPYIQRCGGETGFSIKLGLFFHNATYEYVFITMTYGIYRQEAFYKLFTPFTPDAITDFTPNNRPTQNVFGSPVDRLILDTFTDTDKTAAQL